ncbi:MAG: hypothetical protein HOW71_10180 [Nonomuraea sp.]|nr:hypothetical protein [Nonomuraea sp.]
MPAKKVSARVQAAADPQAAADLLGLLAADASPSVRRVVAARTDTPAEVLVFLAADKDLRGCLARRADLEAATARRLTGDPDRSVRAALAQRTRDGEALAALVADPDASVRAATVHNPRLTEEQRHRLVRDPRAEVRAAMAAHALLNEDDLRLLAADRSVNVRWWLATSPATPDHILRRLADDPDTETQAKATLARPRSDKSSFRRFLAAEERGSRRSSEISG